MVCKERGAVRHVQGSRIFEFPRVRVQTRVGNLNVILEKVPRYDQRGKSGNHWGPGITGVSPKRRPWQRLKDHLKEFTKRSIQKADIRDGALPAPSPLPDSRWRTNSLRLKPRPARKTRPADSNPHHILEYLLHDNRRILGALGHHVGHK